MGLLQRAVETYDCNKERIGVYLEDHTPLAPLGHVVKGVDFEIIINTTGEFISAIALDAKKDKIIVPAKESALGRTSSKSVPYALCEQLKYLVPEESTTYYVDYLKELKGWLDFSGGHPILVAVYSYVQKGTVFTDLCSCGVIKRDKNGNLTDFEKNKRKLVCWRVVGMRDDAEERCWRDKSLFASFQKYYSDSVKSVKKDLCLISGEYSTIETNHRKGIVPVHSNAKLIFVNGDYDTSFRGRFKNATEAATIGLTASQKAHNALSWLLNEQGVAVKKRRRSMDEDGKVASEKRVFLCWNPQGREVCPVDVPLAFGWDPEPEPENYQQQLKNILYGYRSQFPDTATVVIAAFDAATDGRLALTYYSEYMGADFLQRLYDWDRVCCWPHETKGIYSPPLKEIIKYAFGAKQTKKEKTSIQVKDAVMQSQLQRMVVCRLERSVMPVDIVKALFYRASSPQSYQTKADYRLWQNMLSVTCAVIRKYHYDKYKEEFSMVLEPEKKDRSYQYGRLLAVLEKVESSTFKKGAVHETNAMRLMNMFSRRPLYTANQIEKKLEQAYFPQLSIGSQIFYKNLIGEIVEQIHQFPETQWNQPLKETYLMGYYLQRSALRPANNTNETEQTEE